MKIVQIARQYWIAVINLHRGQYVYQVPCMYYLYLYLYISLFLSLSIFTSKSVSISILNCPSVYSSTYTSIRVPTGNMQQKDCLPPITTLCRRPFSRWKNMAWYLHLHRARKRVIKAFDWPSRFSWDHWLWSMLLPSRPLSRTIYTLEDYITAGLKPENDGGSFWFRWWIFFPDFISFYTYSDFFGVNQPFIFQAVPLKNGRSLFPWFLPTFWEVCKENHLLETAEGKGYGRVSRNKNELDHLCHYLLIAGLL